MATTGGKMKKMKKVGGFASFSWFGKVILFFLLEFVQWPRDKEFGALQEHFRTSELLWSYKSSEQMI